MKIETNFSLLVATLVDCSFSGVLHLGNLHSNPYFGYSIDEPEYAFDPPEFKNVRICNKEGFVFREELIGLFRQTIDSLRNEIAAFKSGEDRKQFIIDHQIELNEAIRTVRLRHYPVTLSNSEQIQYMGRQNYTNFEAKLTKAYMSHLVASTLEPLKLVIEAAKERVENGKQVLVNKKAPTKGKPLSDHTVYNDLILSESTINALYVYLSKKVLLKVITLECFKSCFCEQIMLTESLIDYEKGKKLFMTETLRQIFEMPAVRKRYKFAKPTYVKANFNLKAFDQIKDEATFKYSDFRKDIANILKQN